MKRVVSVSLGSSARDFSDETDLGGERFAIERRGCDGDIVKARETIEDLDGRVDAIGLGGVNICYRLGKTRYPCPDGVRLARSAHRTPVVDGSLFKSTYEAGVPRELVRRGFTLGGSRVLVVSALDRWDLAEALQREGAKTLVGDAAMALGLPVVFSGLKTFTLAASLSMWGLCRLPVSMLYPLGKHQHYRTRGREWAFGAVDWVAGDYHFIRRYMPESLPGVWILTSTTREIDRIEFKNAGVSGVITMAPPVGGATLGANVYDAMAAAITGRHGMNHDEAMLLWKQMGLEPHIEVYGR